ncbi:hypothetical protein OIV83_005991 [Microbotryomycetes sp. JL201]|nr:hypothetical protein OIV83_005991 [Microbotryomycetes sp. JL201]
MEEPGAFSAFLPRTSSAHVRSNKGPEGALGTKDKKRRKQTAKLSRIVRLPASPNASHTSRTEAKQNKADDALLRSPYLPLVTRETSHLMANLHTQLVANARSKEPTVGHRHEKPGHLPAGHPDLVWDALAAVIQYPSIVPEMPATPLPLSVRTPIAFPSSLAAANKLHSLEAEAQAEAQRSPITLSLRELRQAFDVFAKQTPRTKTGLQRLIVVAELIALKKAKGRPLGPSVRLGGRRNDTAVREGFMSEGTTDLRGEGLGLRPRDWKTLLDFIGSTYRSPRKEIETEGAFALYAQWSKQLKGRPSGNRPSKAQMTNMHNALLHAAVKSRSWELFDDTLTRMEQLDVRHDIVTAALRLRRLHESNAHIRAVWACFEDAIVRHRNEHARGELWGIIMWAFAERGLFNEAMAIYQARRKGDTVDIHTLRPEDYVSHDDVVEADVETPVLVEPPRVDYAGYAGLIQALCHRGDLSLALSILRDMLASADIADKTGLKVGPTPQIYASLFKGFAQHGQQPNELDTPVPRTMRNFTTRRSASIGSSFSALSHYAATSVDDSSKPLVEWSLTNLEKLFTSFLTLDPPRPGPHLPFNGQRTAPSSKELFWLVLAYENLTGQDSDVVLERWMDVERHFAHEGSGWKGWKVDKRLASRIQRHKIAVMTRTEEGV